MKIKPKDFRVEEGEKVDLSVRPTRTDPAYASKAECAAILREHTETLSDLQQRVYASGRYAILLIFQGMDAAGKDSAIRHVMSGVNPQGCHVSFKQPSSAELKHDFLWRTTCALPERGQIGIFNRSYYEEVLITRVHPKLLASEGLQDQKGLWRDRLRSIRDLERHLDANATRVVKVFLHLSKDEQRKRFLARIDQPRKNWKLDVADIEERDLWKDYQKAYEHCIGATSTRDCPWYIVPADDKPNARLIISRILIDTLKALKLDWPKVTEAQHEALLAIRDRLSS